MHFFSLLDVFCFCLFILWRNYICQYLVSISFFMTFFSLNNVLLFYGSRFKTIHLSVFDASSQLVGASHVIFNFCILGVCIICN